MKNYHRLASMIFNQPMAVTDQMLDLGVAWANRAMNLNIINLPSARLAEPQSYYDDSEPRAETPGERRRRAASETGVYVLPVHGLLVSREAHLQMCETMTSYEDIRTSFRAAIADPAVSHIVMDVDSPGGSALGCGELAEEIYAARSIKPITAIANFSAYSAAYWIASAASTLIVSQTSGVGSIGVIARHLDLSAKLQAEGVKITPVFAGARKNDLNSAEPASVEALGFLHGMVQDMYEQFTEAVARNRGQSVATIRETEAGVFFGKKAVARGLADQVETPQVAVDRIAADAHATRRSVSHRSVSARAVAADTQNKL